MTKLVLYSDAKAKNNRFGITDADGNPLWYGLFFDSDRDYNGEQSTGEMAAAKKAVWLAGKIKEILNLKNIELELRVDAEWLTWANEANRSDHDGKTGGKALKLAYAAKKAGIELTVEHVRGVDNPADKYTICYGHKSWRDNDFEKLINKA